VSVAWYLQGRLDEDETCYLGNIYLLKSTESIKISGD